MANLEKAKEKVVFLNMQDVHELTGWCEATIKNIFTLPEFPAIKIGKQNQVELSAFQKFFDTRRELRGEK